MTLAFVMSFVVTLIVLIVLLRTRLSKIALDQPNHRSLHTKLVPRTGGVAMMAGILSAWMLTDNPWLWIIPVVLLLGISLLDDIRGLPVRWRLLAQLIISASMAMVLMPDYPWWLQGLVILAITWMINLYNFMDGSDGLAGGMALFGFAGYAVAAVLANDMQMAAMNAAIVGASLAFLLFNFHPARIFLGDGGSVPLGFLAGAIGLYGWEEGLWPVWFPVLVFSPFIIDASATLLKRLLSGEKIWQAHRTHYYQRLIQLGWSHRRTALAEYGLMMAASGTGLMLIGQPLSILLTVLAFWLLSYLAMLWVIDRQWAINSR